jgi:hypothetical protein
MCIFSRGGMAIFSDGDGGVYLVMAMCIYSRGMVCIFGGGGMAIYGVGDVYVWCWADGCILCCGLYLATQFCGAISSCCGVSCRAWARVGG